MDISTFLPGLNKHESELTDAERVFVKTDAPKHGPVKMRTISAGQQRRAVDRARAAHSRKATRRNRREWHQTQQALATLRGQLQTLGLLPWADGSLAAGDPTTVGKVTLYLEEAWGTTDAALEAYQAATGRR